MKKRDELAEKYASLSDPEITRLQMIWDYKNGYDAGVKTSQEEIKMLVAALESIQSLALGAFDMPKTKFNAYCTEKSFRYASQALTQHRKMNEGK